MDCLVEFVGTFFYLTIIIVTGGNPIAAAIGLAAALYLGGFAGKAHYNPAVSVMMLADGRISPVQCAIFVAFQLLGGIVAAAAFYWSGIRSARTVH